MSTPAPPHGSPDDEYAAAVALWHGLGDDGRRTVLRLLLRMHELGQEEELDAGEAGDAGRP